MSYYADLSERLSIIRDEVIHALNEAQGFWPDITENVYEFDEAVGHIIEDLDAIAEEKES